MSAADENTQVDAATSHLCSRGVDSAGVGDGYGQLSDPLRTAPRTNKSYAARFQDRDQTDDEKSDSKTPHPISQRTRSKVTKKQRKYAVARDSGDDVEEDLESGDEFDADEGCATSISRSVPEIRDRSAKSSEIASKKQVFGPKLFFGGRTSKFWT